MSNRAIELISDRNLGGLCQYIESNISCLSDMKVMQAILELFNEDPEFASNLLQACPVVGTEDGYGDTLLHYASRWDFPHSIKQLINQGFDIDYPNNGFQSPLFHASQASAQELIHLGASVNLQDINNRTALSYAVEYEQYDLAELLLLHGADVNLVDDYDKTVIFYAVENENIEMIDLLAKHGADFHVIDRNNLTPLAFSRGFNNPLLTKHITQLSSITRQLSRISLFTRYNQLFSYARHLMA